MARSCISLNCSECQNPFSIELRSYNIYLKKGRTDFWCSHECMLLFKRKLRVEVVNCIKCGVPFERSKTIKKRRITCSYECAHSHDVSDDQKQKTSITLLKRYENIEKKRYIVKVFECRICDKPIECRGYYRIKYCSANCRKIGVNSNNTLGGYREGAGRSKHGYFRGMYCASTYELVYVIHNMDHGVEFERFNGSITDGKVKYFPDFFIKNENKIIEIKGFENREKVEYKTRMAKDLGFNIDVLYKVDLEYAFDYVREKYNTSKFYDLYDNFRLKFEYSCDMCGVNFARNKNIITQNKFCSRKCSGYYRRKCLTERTLYCRM